MIGFSFGIPSEEECRRAAECGFGYAEISIRNYMQLAADERAAFLKRMSRGPLPVRTGNCLFPGEMKLLGPAARPAEISEYLNRTFGELAEGGLRIAVMGSGAARRIPDGWTRAEAEAGFEAFCREQLEVQAEKAGITTVIEPLRRQETDFLNQVGETVSFLKKLGLSRVCVLADYYHMADNGEDGSGIREAGALLRHTHIARPGDRGWPLPDDGADYSSFFPALREIGYAGDLTYEGQKPQTEEDWRELKRSCRFLRDSL